MSKIAQQCKSGTLHLVKIPEKYKEKIGMIAEKSFDDAGKLFAFQKPVEAVIFPNIPEMVISEMGIGGITTDRGDIVISMDFSRRNIKNIIEKHLPTTIYHELSHAVRGTWEYQTLLESVVGEGIASYIETKIFNVKIPYIEPIQNEMKYWKQAQENWQKKQSYEERREWFFGSKKLPRWIGYRLGYLMMEGYMKSRPEISFAQLVRLDAGEILKRCGLS